MRSHEEFCRREAETKLVDNDGGLCQNKKSTASACFLCFQPLDLERLPADLAIMWSFSVNINCEVEVRARLENRTRILK